MRRSDDLAQWLRQRGWSLVRRTERGHCYYEHPDASERLLVGGSGKARGDRNAKAMARRMLR